MAPKKIDPDLWLIEETTLPAEARADAIGAFLALHPSGWRLSGLIGERGGVPVFLSICLEPMTPPAFLSAMGVDPEQMEVTGLLLRDVPLGRLRDDLIARVASRRSELQRTLAKPVRKVVDAKGVVIPTGITPSRGTTGGELVRALRKRDEAEAGRLAAFPVERPKSGRRPTPDAELRKLATDLLRLQDTLSSGERRFVVTRLAGERDCLIDTMRSRVKKVVKAGYLVSAGRGTYLPGPRLTEGAPNQ